MQPVPGPEVGQALAPAPPRAATVSPVRLPFKRGERDAAARAAAAAAVVEGHRARRAVGRDRAGVRDGPDADHDDAAARRAAATGRRCCCCACPSRRRAPRTSCVTEAGKSAPPKPPMSRPLFQDFPPLPPAPAVAAASAAGVLVVGGRMSVGAAAARVAGSAAGRAAVDRRALVRIVGAGGDRGRRRGVVDPAGRAGDAFSLGAVEVLRRVLDVVGVGAARVAGELPGAAAAETEPVHADGGAAEVEGARDVDREDRRPSFRSRPRRSGRKSAWPRGTGARGRPGSGAGPGWPWRWRSCTC